MQVLFRTCLMEEQECCVLEAAAWQFQYLLGGCNDCGERTC